MSEKNTLKVKVAVYREILVIETISPEEDDPDFVPAGDGRFGCVLVNTEGRLGISAEAVKRLREVPKTGDGLGDVDAFRLGDGRGCFGWIGDPVHLVKIKTISGSRDYGLEAIGYQTIPNTASAKLVAIIDAELG